MTTSNLTDRDIEAVFAGSVVREPDLAAMQLLFSSMRQTLVVEPPAGHVSAFALVLAQAAIDAPRDVRAKGPRSLRRRIVAIGLGVGISAFGVAGAAAANEAAPGDTLYGFDKALESVAILDGGMNERFQEAEVLAARGNLDGAVALTVEALDADGQHDAAVALERAVAAVGSQSSGDDVRAQVSSMLEWMSQQERGADFGANVSDHARAMEHAANASANADTDASAGADANANPDANANADANVNPDANANANANPDANANADANVNPDANANANANPDANANPPADPGSKASPPAAATGKKP